MSWQLWVVIALAATGLVLLAAARMQRARHVFDDIVRLDRSPQPQSGDELARARARRMPTEPARHRKHG
jgi:hypothetical protein